MIFEITCSNMPAAISSGASIIIMSADSKSALVQAETIDVEYIQSYPDEELNTLLGDIKWRQPCKDCEV